MAPPEPGLEDFRARVLAARDRLRALPPGMSDRRGPVDPETGESWDAVNVLGHTAEMLPFWVSQLRAGLRGRPYGRDEEGYRRRRAGIDTREEERRLRLQVDRGCQRLLTLLDRLDETDLERSLNALPGRPAKVREALEHQLVGHLEAHVDQLAHLG